MYYLLLNVINIIKQNDYRLGVNRVLNIKGKNSLEKNIIIIIVLIIILYPLWGMMKDELSGNTPYAYNECDLMERNLLEGISCIPEESFGIVSQSFIATDDIISGIQIKTITGGDVNRELEVSLKQVGEENDKTWVLKQTENKQVDEAVQILKCEPMECVNEAKGKTFVIEITGKEGKNVLCKSNANYYSDGELEIDGNSQDTDLWFQVEQKDIVYYRMAKFWVRVYIGALLLVVIYKRREIIQAIKRIGKRLSTGITKIRRPTIRDVLFVCACIMGIIVLYWINPYNDFYINSIEEGAPAKAVGPIYGDIIVEQSFVTKEPFNGFSMYMCNFDHFTEDGTYTVELLDKEGKLVQEWKYGRRDITNNIMIRFELDEMQEEIGKEYRITIKAPELREEDAITAWMPETTLNPGGILNIGGQRVENSLCLNIYKHYNNIFAKLGITVFLATIFLLWWNRRKEIEVIAGILLLGLGLCYILIFSPFSEPDSRYHYPSSYMLSNIMTGEKNIGVMEYTLDTIAAHYNADSNFVYVMQHYRDNENSFEEYCFTNRQNNLNHPIVYVATALGITIGRIANLSYMQVYYWGRLINLLLYTIIVLISIHVTPKFKYTILFTALLPMCMQQATSYSYDMIINGISFLIMAYLLHIYYECQRVTWRQVIFLAVFYALLIPVKGVYLPLLLLLFIIPKERYDGKKDFIKKNMIVIMSGFGSIFIIQLAGLKSILMRNGVYMGKQVYSVSDAIMRPLLSVKIMIRTMYENGWDYCLEIAGKRMAGLSLLIPSYVIVGYFIILFMSVIMENVRFNIRDKLKMSFCAIGGGYTDFIDILSWYKAG